MNIDIEELRFQRVVGIDIGNEGGIVYPNEDGVRIIKMPELACDQWNELKKASLLSIREMKIYAENVHTMPGQGMVSQGTLMKNRGRIEGYAAAMGIDVTWINPLQWIECFTMKRTKHFPTKDQWKRHLIEIAKDIAGPELAPLITKKTADAFLIWVYGASQKTKNPLKPIAVQFYHETRAISGPEQTIGR